MYVAVVAIFQRFAEVAIDHQPVVTDMQQTNQHLPGASGTTVSGYVQFYDADGDPITSYGFTEPNDSRFTVTVVDGTNGRMNWTVWDWNPLGPSTPKTLTFTLTVLAQGDGQISVSKPYMPNGNETQKTVTVTVYYNQAVGTMTNTVASTSAMGVVRGVVSTPAEPGQPDDLHAQRRQRGNGVHRQRRHRQAQCGHRRVRLHPEPGVERDDGYVPADEHRQLRPHLHDCRVGARELRVAGNHLQHPDRHGDRRPDHPHGQCRRRTDELQPRHRPQPRQGHGDGECRRHLQLHPGGGWATRVTPADSFTIVATESTGKTVTDRDDQRHPDCRQQRADG